MPGRTHRVRHRLARPPSKQILQLREGDDDYEEEYQYYGNRSSRSFGSNASPTSTDVAHAVGSSGNANNDDVVVDDDAAGGGRRVRSSSPLQKPHNLQERDRDDDGDVDDSRHGDSPICAYDGQRNRGGHAAHCAMTASARRGGKSSRKSTVTTAATARNNGSNGHSARSCSSRAALTSLSTAARSPQQRSRVLYTSPVVSGGRVRYYGPPPATALVSSTHASPTSSGAAASDFATTEDVCARGDAANGTPSPSERCSDVPSALGGASHGADRTQTPSLAGSSDENFPGATESGAGPSTKDAGRSTDTPLTYAAVASASSCAASLRGKRLPQSRVGFANLRKRTCGSMNSNGNVSVGSTARSTQGTPATAMSPSTLLLAEYIEGNGYSTRGYCASSCGFPSVPLTPVTQGTPPFASSPRLAEPASPVRLAPLAVATADDAAVTAAAAGGEEGLGEEKAEGDGDGGEPRMWAGHPTSAAITPTTTIAGTTTTMPPLPPKLHRHHPTNLFLQLPDAHAHCTDSDEEHDTTVAAASPSPPPPATATAATNNRPATQQQQQNEQKTGSTSVVTGGTARPAKHAHTGPATAAKAAAGLHLRLLPTPAVATPSATASTASTPCAPTVQQQQQQAPPPSSPLHAGSDATPTGPTPPTVSVVNGRGMHKVSSTLAFFSAVEIIPGLFLGCYGDAMDAETLAAHGISLVINCTLECPVTAAMVGNRHHVRYLQCPLRDHSDEVISPFFSPVSQIIHEQLHRRQIGQQRSKRVGAAAASAKRLSCGGSASSAAAAARVAEDTVRGMDESLCRCRCGGAHSSLNCTKGKECVGPAGYGGEEDVSGDHRDAESDRLLWTWTDEAENVWAVPTSPASLPLSVGGQPSLKEGKRETPRTPSSAVAAWGRGSDSTASLCTSGSPSPMPGRTSTFPGTASTGGAVTADLPTGVLFKGSAAPAAAATVTAAAAVHGVTASTSATATAAATQPLTVVDPRDCGGVLVHCRMGVSRSATFVMAYLILYGTTLANLEDTASLFVRFLERERTLMEDAGGRARFGLDVTGIPAQASALQTPTTTGSPIHGRSTFNGSGNGNAAQRFASPLRTTTTTTAGLFLNGSLQFGSRSSVVGPPGSGSGSCALTPVQASLGSRRPIHGIASWNAARNGSGSDSGNGRCTNTNSNSASNSNLSGSDVGGGGVASSPLHRRSSAIPVSSPLFSSNGGGVASPRSTTSASQLRPCAPATPLEQCSRVCRPCHLVRMRERRLHQQAKKQLLLSGQQQQQQREAEEEEQMLALAALSRMRGDAQAAGSGGVASPVSSGVTAAKEERERDGESRSCVACGGVTHDDDKHQQDRSEGTRFWETLTPREHTQQAREQQQRRLELLRPTPSSAPVISHRGSRGRFGRAPTLLEAAQDAAEDEEAARVLELKAVEGGGGTYPSPAASGLEVGAPLRNAFSVSKASTAAATATVTPLTTTPRAPCAEVNTAANCATPPYIDLLLTGCVNGSDRRGAVGTSNYVFNSCESSSLASSHSMFSGDLAPAMTFREAFDAVKREKSDVNPNIGFILALRELAGGGDFSFSTSL